MRWVPNAAGRAAAVAAVAVLTLAGCSDFSHQASPGTFTPQSELPPEDPPQPRGPDGGGGASPPSSSQGPVPPPNGCEDFHPNVIGTCLSALSAVAVLPLTGGQPSALAAERSTGRVLQVSKGTDPTQLAKLAVDTTGDGGLTGLALSPNYDEDQLIFAYVTTRTDNEVVQFAAGQPATPVLRGIPRGSADNAGGLALDHTGALLVATGDAGNAGAAADPKSLAGKVLRITPDGKPAPGNPNPTSPVLASGLHSPGGVCATQDGATSYVTERAGPRDLLLRVQAGKQLGEPTWSWADKPGVAGCSASADLVTVNTSTAGNMQGITLNSSGAVSGKPQVSLDSDKGYGRLTGMDIISDQLAVIGTANKTPGGRPVSSDDRVVIIERQAGGGTGKD